MYCGQMLDQGVLLSVTKRSILDKCKLGAGIRITVSAGHTEAELINVASLMNCAIGKVLGS